MKLRPVVSEMLIAAGYDRRSRILEVIFRTGETYRYKGVPSSRYEGLMSADSKGKYMHRHIIGHYDYERV
ncbi:MAG TPA: KTSC domain-containing protein [Pyrinomonadaceae bacterium]|nr:KTSC domain-containing protein [Pyrinomonadaceae bacterium]HEU4871906.1 KTSC domain-containing protein [Pyrinomonadaceae bacterium]